MTQQIALLLRALDGFRLPLHALPKAAQAPVYTIMHALARAVESVLEPAVLVPLRALSATQPHTARPNRTQRDRVEPHTARPRRSRRLRHSFSRRTPPPLSHQRRR